MPLAIGIAAVFLTRIGGPARAVRTMKSKLRTALRQKDVAAIRQFLSPAELNAKDRDGRTLLMNAMSSLNGTPDAEIVKLFIENGADVNAVDRESFSALHFAAMEGLDEIVLALLKAGAHVDAKDAWGDTPLWRAVMSSSLKRSKIIASLLEYGANPDEGNVVGESPRNVAETIGDDDTINVFKSR